MSFIARDSVESKLIRNYLIVPLGSSRVPLYIDSPDRSEAGITVVVRNG